MNYQFTKVLSILNLQSDFNLINRDPQLPLYKVQLVLEEGEMCFSPPLDELEDTIKSVVMTVCKSLQNVPGVQSWLSGEAAFYTLQSS